MQVRIKQVLLTRYAKSTKAASYRRSWLTMPVPSLTFLLCLIMSMMLSMSL